MTLALEHDVPLAPHTTLGLGGPARHLVRAHDRGTIAAAVRWAGERGLPVLLLGGGSNVVIADEGFRGLVVLIATRGLCWAGPDADGRISVTAEAGEPWDALVAEAVARGLAGLECLSGIPGSVGATPIQNVGAYGQDVAETITAVTVLDRRTGRIEELEPAACKFAYRDSAFKHARQGHVVLAVTYALTPGGVAAVRYAELAKALGPGPAPLARVRDTVLALRRRKSMVLTPDDPNRRSVGSFFTNPVMDDAVADAVVARALADGLVSRAEEVPRWPDGAGRSKLAAGWLIERAGVGKGLRRGSVGVSSAHALALVHHGGGTTAELLALAREVREAVLARFGVTLVPEPLLVGVSL